jgi:peptidoglycan/LPS O-acetylase OafA/YrhL
MHVLALEHDWGGYVGAGTALAFGALGVIAGVRLLGLRSRGLALGLAWVGILIWLAVLAFVAGPHPGLGSLAIYVLGVAGCVYVILALRRWRDPGALLRSCLAVRHDEVHAFNLCLTQADEM